MWVLYGNDILSGVKLVSHRSTSELLARVLFKLNVVQQILAPLDAFREVDIPGRGDSDDMGMLAEWFEGYRIMVFTSRLT